MHCTPTQFLVILLLVKIEHIFSPNGWNVLCFHARQHNVGPKHRAINLRVLLMVNAVFLYFISIKLSTTKIKQNRLISSAYYVYKYVTGGPFKRLKKRWYLSHVFITFSLWLHAYSFTLHSQHQHCSFCTASLPASIATATPFFSH